MNEAVKVHLTYTLCSHAADFMSPGVEDPAGVYSDRAKDVDGVVRVIAQGRCWACTHTPKVGGGEEEIPPSGKVLALEVLAEGIVSQIHAVEKQLGMIMSERVYFEKMIYLSMRGQLNG